jgi:ribonuclease VapC
LIADSSALVAIVIEEPGYESVLDKIVTAGGAGAGAPTLVETGIVLRDKLGPAGRTLLTASLEELAVQPLPFLPEHWPVAVDAFARFGRGRHPAGLNFGDCLTYAIAKVANEPLLCLGDDFAHTDLELA